MLDRRQTEQTQDYERTSLKKTNKEKKEREKNGGSWKRWWKK